MNSFFYFFFEKEKNTRGEKDTNSIKLKLDIKAILDQVIIKEEYPRCLIEISFDIISSRGNIKQQMINSACFALVKASVQIYDRFYSCSVVRKKKSHKRNTLLNY